MGLILVKNLSRKLKNLLKHARDTNSSRELLSSCNGMSLSSGSLDTNWAYSKPDEIGDIGAAMLAEQSRANLGE